MTIIGAKLKLKKIPGLVFKGDKAEGRTPCSVTGKNDARHLDFEILIKSKHDINGYDIHLVAKRTKDQRRNDEGKKYIGDGKTKRAGGMSPLIATISATLTLSKIKSAYIGKADTYFDFDIRIEDKGGEILDKNDYTVWLTDRETDEKIGDGHMLWLGGKDSKGRGRPSEWVLDWIERDKEKEKPPIPPPPPPQPKKGGSKKPKKKAPSKKAAPKKKKPRGGV